MKSLLKAISFSVLLIAAVSSAYAEDNSITVEALPDQTTVTVGMMFLVRVRVLNSSDSTTGFWANTCSFDKQWVTDPKSVFIQAWTCEENGLERIGLDPDGVYEKSVILYVPTQEKTGPVTFRLGFKRMDESGDMTEPVWGEPVTIRVIVPAAASPEGITEAPEEPVSGSSKTDSGPVQIYKDPAVPIHARTGETFSISLVSNPSTGYSWKMDFSEEEKSLALLDSKHVASPEPMMGAPGTQVYTFKVLKSGQTKIRLVYGRSWVPSSADTREVFTVIAQ